jgi:hypothetical protein
MFIKPVDFYKKQDVFAVPMKGIVVDNADPKRLGRVKATITGIFEETDFTKLPWILPVNPAATGGKSDSGGQAAPDIGSELVIEFPYKSQYFAFYTGYWQSETTHQGAFTEDYPHTYGTRDTQGTFTKVNRAKGYANFRHFSGTEFIAERDGKAQWQSPDTMEFMSTDGQMKLTLDMTNGKMSLLPRDSSIIQSPDHTLNTDKNTETVGTHKHTVSGKSETTVLGSMSDKAGGSRSVSTVGNKSEVVAGKTTKTYAQNVDETYGMTKEEMYVLGSKIAKILAGNHEVEVTLGNIAHKTLAGSVEMGNPLAKLAYDLAGGAEYSSTLDTTIKALLNVAIQATLNLNMKANLMATMEASVQAQVKAAIVLLGNGTSPVLTMATSPLIDLITGAPTIGVPTVLAG